MSPVFQTRFGLEGNCFAACVASILGCPITDVPIVLDGNQNRSLNEWLAPRGLFYFEFEIRSLMTGAFEDAMGIFTVESDTPEVREKGFTHAVVGKWDRLGRPVLIHDPKPGADQARAIQPLMMGVFLRRDLAFADAA